MESEIRWGTGYDNIIEFEYPQALDDMVAYRKPVPGSRRARNGAGVTDAWERGRDFILSGKARWFKDSAWPNLQDFLDWAGAGNAFRFVPDNRYPNFYIGDCYLDEPYDDPRPELEPSDGSQSVALTIRQQAYDFNLAKRGLMFEYFPGKSLTDPSSMLATYSRGSVARRVGRDGVVTSQASGELRDRHFVSSYATRTALVEMSRSNVCLQSENFGTTWTTVGSPTRSAAAHTASGITLDLLGDDDAAAAEAYAQSVVFTGDAAKCISIFIKQGSATSTLIGMFDLTSGGADRLNAKITWSGGLPVITTTTGTSLGYETLKDGVFRILLRSAAVTAANTNSLRVYPASDNTVLASATGNVYVGGVQAEDAAGAPSSYIPTTSAGVARSVDALYFPFAFVPQELTMYIKFWESGAVGEVNGVIACLGPGTAAGAYLRLSENGGAFTGYRALHWNGSGIPTSAPTGTPTLGQLVELRVVLASTGAITCGQSIGGGTETVGATSAVNALASSWGETRLYLGQATGGASPGLAAYEHVKVAAGTKTLAEMRLL